MTGMIEVSNLAKRYGRRWVLRGVELRVGESEIVAMLGPNGAGKTTLLRILATLSRPTSGRVMVGGHRLPDEADAARVQLGLLAHQPLLYGDLSAEQNLHFAANLYGVADGQDRVDEVLELVGLAARRRDPVRIFSRGMQQRLAIARSILHRPRILLLDEPHTGLDREAAGALDELLRGLAKEGCSILMATHDLGAAASLANRIEVLVGGQVTTSLSGGDIKRAPLERAYARAVEAGAEAARG
jgi:heme exporter protein A